MAGGRGEAVRSPEDSLRRVLERPRYELVPTEDALEQISYLPPKAEVAITCSPTLGIDSTLALAGMLSDQGFRAVPHLAARQVESEAHLRAILHRLNATSIGEVFVVGGDARWVAGPYAGGLDLLRTMGRLEHDLRRIGVPAYPEGHPFIRDDELVRVLLAKQDFASYVVTQICFDSGTILSWLERMREGGLALPVYAGVPGAVDRGRLLRVSLKIGVGSSLRYLRKQHGLAGRLLLHSDYAPDELVEALSPFLGDGGIHGLHFNTFNQVERTERWRRGMLASLDGDESRSSGETP